MAWLVVSIFPTGRSRKLIVSGSIFNFMLREKPSEWLLASLRRWRESNPGRLHSKLVRYPLLHHPSAQEVFCYKQRRHFTTDNHVEHLQQSFLRLRCAFNEMIARQRKSLNVWRSLLKHSGITMDLFMLVSSCKTTFITLLLRSQLQDALST